MCFVSIAREVEPVNMPADISRSNSLGWAPIHLAVVVGILIKRSFDYAAVCGRSYRPIWRRLSLPKSDVKFNTNLSIF